MNKKLHFYCLKNHDYDCTFDRHFYSFKEYTNAEFVDICNSLIDRSAKDALNKCVKQKQTEENFPSLDWTDITMRMCELLEEKGFHAIHSMEAFIVGSCITTPNDFNEPAPGTYANDMNRVRKDNVSEETIKNIVAFNSMLDRTEPEW